MIDHSLFENTGTAFKLKSDSELERAYFLFKMISAYISEGVPGYRYSGWRQEK